MRPQRLFQLPAVRSAGRVPKQNQFLQVTTHKEVKSADEYLYSSGARLMKARYVTARRVAAVGATLTTRERAVLETLGTIRVATARQLVSLHCGDIGARQGRAVLASLAERQVIARLTRVMGGARAGSAGYLYTLGPVGVRLLDRARRGRPWEVGSLFLAHSLAVSQLHVELALAERAGRFEQVTFVGEPACWRSFYGPGGARVVVKPDAYVRLVFGRYIDHWLVEVDRGTESRTTIARKAEIYRRYWQSGTEQAKTKTGVFPVVLFLVPDETRREVITEVLSRQPAEAWDLFQVTTMSEAVTRLAQGAQS